MKATRVVESFMVYYNGEESKDFQVPGGVLNRTVCVIYVFNVHCENMQDAKYVVLSPMTTVLRVLVYGPQRSEMVRRSGCMIAMFEFPHSI